MRKDSGFYTKYSHGHHIKAMVKIMNPNKAVFPHVSLPNPKKIYKPRINARKSHKQPEEKIVRDIVDYLRLNGMKCGRVRTISRMIMWFYTKDKILFHGVPDILVYNPFKKLWWWVEVKAGYNTLSKRQPLDEEHEYSQEEFMSWCLESSQNYILARSRIDVEPIIKEK